MSNDKEDDFGMEVPVEQETPKKDFTQCKPIEHASFLPGSYGCCQCRTFNSGPLNPNQTRTVCRHCGHKRCDIDAANKAN